MFLSKSGLPNNIGPSNFKICLGVNIGASVIIGSNLV